MDKEYFKMLENQVKGYNDFGGEGSGFTFDQYRSLLANKVLNPFEAGAGTSTAQAQVNRAPPPQVYTPQNGGGGMGGQFQDQGDDYWARLRAMQQPQQPMPQQRPPMMAPMGPQPQYNYNLSSPQMPPQMNHFLNAFYANRQGGNVPGMPMPGGRGAPPMSGLFR